MTPRLKELYFKQIQPDLKTKFGFKNVYMGISSKKIQLIVSVVDHYIEVSDLDLEVRFDVIAITKERDKWRIKHLKNAFYAWQ